jgi:hypothetical protein
MEAELCFSDDECAAFFSGLASDPNMDPFTVFQASDTPPQATTLWGCMESTMDMGDEYESEGSTSTCDRPCEEVHPDLADGFDLVLPLTTCPGRRGRLSNLSVSLCKSVLYGAFLWALRALKHQKRWFPAWAVDRANCFPMAANLTEGVFAWDGLSYKDSAAGKGRALRLGAYVGSTHPMLLVCHRLQFAEPG